MTRKFLQIFLGCMMCIWLVGTSSHAVFATSEEPTETPEVVITTETPTPTETPELTPTPTPEESASLEHIQTTLDGIYFLLYLLVIVGGATFVVWLLIAPLWYMFR